MGASAFISHFPGAIVFDIIGSMGQPYFWASMEGSGEMEVSLPNRGNCIPAFPEC